MTPASITRFRDKALETQYACHGVDVTFRGETVSVILSPVRVTLGLEMGGLNAGGEYNCRFLQSSVESIPTRGEQVRFNGRKYTVQEVKDTISTVGEYVAVIKPGSLV
jgi:hypothetical protein